MKTICKHPFLTLITILAVNLVLAFFLIAIFVGGIIDYKVGFAVSFPIIVLIIITLVFTYAKYFSRKNSEIRNIPKTIILILLGILIILIYSFNMLCWIDLFDGKTNALLP